jgi:hypothetical protein
MTLNPFRLWRRRRRLKVAIEEEASYLRRSHGEGAYAAAEEQLNGTDLTRWGRQVKEGVAQLLRNQAGSEG